MLKRLAATTALLYVAFMIVSLIVGTVSLAQAPYRRGYPGMGPFANRPPCGTTTDMYLATDTSALYSCNNLVWTLVNGGSGGGDYGFNCAAYVSTDLGATYAACATAAGSNQLLNFSTLPVSQTLSTAIDDTMDETIFLCGQDVTQTAAITLDSLGAALVGCPYQVSTLAKGANLAYQVVINNYSNAVWNMHIDGVRASYTGSGLELTNTSGDDSISHNFITGEATDGWLDGGSYLPNFSENQIYNWGVSAAAISGFPNLYNEDYEGFTDNTRGTPVASTGAAIAVTAGGQLVTNDLILEDNGIVAAITSDDEGSQIFISNSYISQQNGYPAVINAGVLSVSNSTTVRGGGSHGPDIDDTASLSYYFYIVDSTIITANAGADAIDATGPYINISNNVINLGNISTSGAAAVKVLPPASGAIIANNNVTFFDYTPSGVNYGIWLHAGSTGELSQNLISGNSVTLQSNTDDVAMYYDNSASGSAGANDNRWTDNRCINGASTICINSSPESTELNYYSNNTTDSGTLYSGIGAAESVSGATGVYSCGSVAACSPTFKPAQNIAYGTVTLSGGTATLSSVPVSGGGCVGTDMTNNFPVQITGFVLHGNGSDNIQYVCIGAP